MSINMTNVKSITLGGVSVKKIADKNGNVLWQENKGSTINITLGEGQDITINQDYDRIQIPPIHQIINFIASKTGISSSDIKVTNIQIDGSTLYWNNKDSGEQTPYLSFQPSVSSSTVYFGGGTTVSSTGINPWSSSIVNLDGISLDNHSNTVLYGYVRSNSSGKYSAFSPYSTGTRNRFCQGTSYSTVPTFTMVVTYEH